MSDEELMEQAVLLACGSVERGGGPFGAVVAREGKVIGAGTNLVTLANDPTAHAEIVAIRSACVSAGNFQLGGCAVYCSCEPCPMCLGALYWARVDRMVYGCTRADAAAAGFDDEFIYREFMLPAADRSLPVRQLFRDRALRAFNLWAAFEKRRQY